MAAGEGNSSTPEENASLNYQSNQASQYEGTSDTLNVRGYWINPQATPLNTINVTSLQDEGITDVFISTSKSNPSSLQGFITKFNNSGIRVHAWVSCFHDGNNWIDPGNQTQVEVITSSIINIATNYGIDGIHLDYARYSGTPGNEAYRYNGTTHVTSFVQDIYNEIQLINNQDTPDKPYILLSAALMPETSANGYYYGQNYTQLAPYLDFMVPMIYKGNYRKNTTWIAYVTDYIVNAANGTPVVAGLQTYMSDTYAIPIPSSELEGDIQAALDNGSYGYVLFRYGLTDEFEEIPYSYTNLTDILDAANWVKNYINQNGALPSALLLNSTIGTHEIDMPILLSLLTRGLLYINNNDTGPVGVIDYENPTSPSTTIYMGTLTKAEYIDIATRVLNFMNAYGRAPNFSGSSLGNIPYKDLFKIFSNVLDYYKLNNILPDSFSLNDTTPPTVTETNPATNSVIKQTNGTIKVTFTENIKKGTDWIELISGSNAINFTSSISGNVLTIKPTNNLIQSKYTVILHTGSVTDLAGNPLALKSFTFTVDTTPPTITSTDPQNKAINVPPNKVIKVTFSENIKKGTDWIELISAGKYVPFTNSISGKVLTITPTNALAESKYTLILHTGSVTDLAGNPLALKSYIFSVTIPPTVTKTNPASDATKISLTAPIVITFSENIKAGPNYSGIYIKNTISGVKVAISKTISGNTLTIKQTTNKLYNTPYQVYLPAGAVKDTTGNNLAKAYTYKFTTVAKSADTTPPKVTKTNPVNNAVNFSRTAAITITFSENIKAGPNYSGIYMKNLSTGKLVSITKSISGKTLTIKMVYGRLSKNTYQIYLPAAAVKDATGNSLASAYTLKFKTI